MFSSVVGWYGKNELLAAIKHIENTPVYFSHTRMMEGHKCKTMVLCAYLFSFISILLITERSNGYFINRLKMVLPSATGGVKWYIHMRPLSDPDTECNSSQELTGFEEKGRETPVTDSENSRHWDHNIATGSRGLTNFTGRTSHTVPLRVHKTWQADSLGWGQGIFFSVPYCGHVKVRVDQRPGELTGYHAGDHCDWQELLPSKRNHTPADKPGGKNLRWERTGRLEGSRSQAGEWGVRLLWDFTQEIEPYQCWGGWDFLQDFTQEAESHQCWGGKCVT